RTATDTESRTLDLGLDRLGVHRLGPVVPAAPGRGAVRRRARIHVARRWRTGRVRRPAAEDELMPDLVWFVIRRLFAALLVMLALSLAVYLVFYAIPADPAHLACGKPCTPDRLEQARHF